MVERKLNVVISHHPPSEWIKVVCDSVLACWISSQDYVLEWWSPIKSSYLFKIDPRYDIDEITAEIEQRGGGV